MNISNILLGSLVGAGGIGAALYLTGHLKELPFLPPKAELPELPGEVVTVPAAVPVPVPIPEVTAAVAEKVDETAAKVAASPAPAVDMAQLRAEMKQEIQAEIESREKAATAAAEAEAERKRLTGEGWTRQSASTLHRKEVEKQQRLKIPEGWSEEKYFEKYPDVKQAVDRGAFPSGLAHYLRFGKKEGRTFKGWRRPGYLAGIFANWNWR